MAGRLKSARFRRLRPLTRDKKKPRLLVQPGLFVWLFPNFGMQGLACL
jgi:hypothetical protein